MHQIKNITSKGKLYAQIYDLNSNEGVTFPTEDNLEMQCGFGMIAQRTEKKPHIHKTLERKTKNTSEFFFIYEGSVKVTFYDENEIIMHTQNIKSGMGFIQFIGGHGFVFEPKTKYIEIKQGPYFGNVDDKYFLNS